MEFKYWGNTEKRGLDSKRKQWHFRLLTKKEYAFLEESLEARGMSFSIEPSKDLTPYQAIGNENIREYLLNALNSNDGSKMLSKKSIAGRVVKNLGERADDKHYFKFAFGSKYIKHLFGELVEGGKIDRIEAD